MKKLFLILLLAGCSLFTEVPEVKHFGYEVFPEGDGHLIMFEVVFNRFTKEVFMDAAAMQDGTSVFRQDCDYFTQHCYLSHYDFQGLNPKEHILIIDGIETNHRGEVDIYFYLRPGNIVKRITINVP